MSATLVRRDISTSSSSSPRGGLDDGEDAAALGALGLEGAEFFEVAVEGGLEALRVAGEPVALDAAADVAHDVRVLTATGKAPLKVSFTIRTKLPVARFR